MQKGEALSKEPRFHGVVTEKSHNTMSKIKGKDTKPEIILRRALWEKGIRYRKNYKSLAGRPDIVITKYKVAIFVDSEFFHGKDWTLKKESIRNGTNGDYWTAKIERNIERDMDKDKELKALGYRVIHLWSKDILSDVNSCIKVINEAIFEQTIKV